MLRNLTHFALGLLVLLPVVASAQEEEPARAFAIKAPRPDSVDRFNNFIRTELSARGVNTLILRVD
ncbi:MAG: hypothetical protein P8L44_04400 [Opitutales bacterium]|jgi:hypothetical protein|nr:hypothetical protein [Opitutales bacterium]